jgi:hypothetical protein
MSVWTARRSSTTVAEEVYDVGAVWVLRFSAQGETGAIVRVTRRQLQADHWRVQIPPAVGEEFRHKGAQPPP